MLSHHDHGRRQTGLDSTRSFWTLRSISLLQLHKRSWTTLSDDWSWLFLWRWTKCVQWRLATTVIPTINGIVNGWRTFEYEWRDTTNKSAGISLPPMLPSFGMPSEKTPLLAHTHGWDYLLKSLEHSCSWHVDRMMLRHPLHPQQHGFCSARSTKTAISGVVDYVGEAIYNKSHYLAAFLDLLKQCLKKLKKTNLHLASCEKIR